MKYNVVVRLKLEYAFDTETAQEAYKLSQNVELPKEYVEWSRETVNITDDKWNIYSYNPEDNEI